MLGTVETVDKEQYLEVISCAASDIELLNMFVDSRILRSTHSVFIFVKAKHLCRRANFVSFNFTIRVRHLTTSDSLNSVGLRMKIELKKYW